jgi:hypothetical protein
VRKEEEMAA